ncbi:MAG TPA: hypothetical protein VFT69_01320 [Pseudolabrys sp.]|nr:hypothetical protein [Pseudolabrys sp.]
MLQAQNGSERVIRVAEIDPKHRHTIILQLFDHLGGGDSLQLIVGP